MTEARSRSQAADAIVDPLQVLLLEHDINTSPFTPAVHACVPPLPWAVTQADVDDPNRCSTQLDGILHEGVSKFAGHPFYLLYLNVT